MKTQVVLVLGLPILLLPLLGGCPTAGTTPIAGPTGVQGTVSDEATARVVSPGADLTLPGGAPLEVVYQVSATTASGTAEVFFDLDQDPDNGNEVGAFAELPLTQTSALTDTSILAGATYFVGVAVREGLEITAFDYAPGRVRINQAPQLTFLSPRSNFRFDRSQRVNPQFDVTWTVDDPDSTVSVEILLDPDADVSGDEVVLRRSNSQTGDTFSFELRTALFEPGTYDVVALVSDGVSTTRFDAPGSITLNSRLAGFYDLRDLDDPTAGELSGAIFEGFNPGDNAGTFVEGLRDIDGDGFGDLMILAQYAKPLYQFGAQRTGSGEAYMIFGRSDRFSGRINLNSTGTLFRGYIFRGIPEVSDPIRPSRGLKSFDLLDDWDNDGLRELAFGVPFIDSAPADGSVLDTFGFFRSGAVIVVAASSLRPDLGVPGRDVLGLADAGALAHKPFECNPCCLPPTPCCPQGFYGTKAYPISCGNTYFEGHWTTVEGDPPIFGGTTLGCRFSTNGFGDQFGEDISRYAFRSILMAGPNRDPRVSTLFNNNLDRSIPGAGSISCYFVETGWSPWSTVNAPPAAPEFGYAPGGFDSDALPYGGPYFYIVDDFDFYLIGAFGSSVSLQGSPGYARRTGSCPDDCSPMFYDGNTPDEDSTFRVWSAEEGTYLSSVAELEDFNSDGLLDFTIGAPFLEDGRGACFIILGRLRDLMEGAELQLQELALPGRDDDRLDQRIFDGIRVVGDVGDRLGQEQASAGDFNSDGVADVAIGSPFLANRQGGAAVFFGSRTVMNQAQNEIPFEEIADRGLGVIFTGEAEGDLAGVRVRNAGDIDRDGIEDLLISAPNRSVRLDFDNDGVLEINRSNCGVVYLVYGSPDLQGTISLADVGTAALPGAVFVGRESDHFLGADLNLGGERSEGVAGAGDIDGDGFGDIVLSAVNASPRDRVSAGEVYLIYGAGN